MWEIIQLERSPLGKCLVRKFPGNFLLHFSQFVSNLYWNKCKIYALLKTQLYTFLLDKVSEKIGQNRVGTFPWNLSNYFLPITERTVMQSFIKLVAKHLPCSPIFNKVADLRLKRYYKENSVSCFSRQNFKNDWFVNSFNFFELVLLVSLLTKICHDFLKCSKRQNLLTRPFSKIWQFLLYPVIISFSFLPFFLVLFFFLDELDIAGSETE